MDESKKDSTAEGENNSDLTEAEELEQIRDMFQQALDEATAAENAGGKEADDILIQDLDDIDDKENEDEIDPDELCACCGEKKRDTSYGENYPYCADCRNLMQHNPFNWFGILGVCLMLVVTFASYYVIKDSLDSFITLSSAQSYYDQKKLVDAANAYDQYLASADSSSVSMIAVKNGIDIMANLGYYQNADELIEKFFTKEQLESKKYSKYKEISDEYALLTDTSAVVNELIGDALSGEKFDYDEKIQALDKIIEENKTSSKYSPSFLEYSKYLVMLLNSEPKDKQLNQLKKLEEIDKGQHPWLYLTFIMELAGKTGDTATAETYFNKCMDINVQEIQIYNFYADAYRTCDKPDADKILEIAELAAKNASSYSGDYWRSYAIGYLLKHDGEKAMQAITQYIQSASQPTVNDFNLYALCAAYIKDNTSYKQAENILKQSGFEIGSSVKKFKNGKATLEEVLTAKEGDI